MQGMNELGNEGEEVEENEDWRKGNKELMASHILEV